MIHKLLTGKGRMKKAVSLLLCLALLGSSVITSNVTAEAESGGTAVEAVELSETEDAEVVEADDEAAGSESTEEGGTTEEEAVATEEQILTASESGETPAEEESTEMEEAPSESSASENTSIEPESAEEVSSQETKETAANKNTDAPEETLAVEANDESTEGTEEASLPETDQTAEDTIVSVSENAKTIAETVNTEADYTEYSATVTVDGVTVEVFADAGVLPEDAKLSVVHLTADDSETADQYSEAEAALAESDVSYDGFIALDISFLDANGNEIEPEQGAVTVKLSVDSSLLDEDVDEDSLAVQHLAETGSGLVVETVADAGTVTDAAVETSASGDVSTEFTVDSFSYFTLTYNSNSSLTIYLVDGNGNELDGGSLGSSNISNTNWTAIGTAASSYISQAEEAGYTYVDAHIGSYTGTTVTYIKYRNNGSTSERGWRYSSASSAPNNNENGTSVGSNAIYLVFSGGSGGSSSGSTNEPADISPAYSKYVADNGNDTYDLTLTVTGGISTTEEKAKIDIIYVLDVSGSMAYNMSSNSGSNNERLTAANSAITTLTNSLANNSDLDVRYALVTFSGQQGGTYDDATTVVNWTNSASTLTGNLPTSANGGTNYEAGLRNAATLLSSARSGAITVVVFVSDGDPTFYYNTRGQTTGSGGSYDATAMSNAQSQLASMNMNYFISVGVGIESNYSKLQNLNSSAASGVTTAYYAGTDSTSLQNAFSAIQSLITTYAFSNVTVTDTLSENVTIVTNASGSVDLTITVTDKEGTVQASGVGSVILSDGTEITASYDSSSKTITLNFPDTYELEDGWTYSVTATVEASDTAYENYQTNDGYTDTGDAGTDAPGVSESNYISSGKAGVYTNSSATLTYTYNSVENTVEYSKPVIPLKFGTLVIEKTIEGLDGVSVETLEALKDTLTFSYTLNGGTADSVTLGDFTYDEATGKYLYTISGLKAGTTYTVTESGADSLTSYGYRLDTTATNSDVNEESGTIAKDITSTASFTNVYVPAEQTVTITKIVDGNMGDTTKNFSFTLTLADSDGNAYGDSLLAKKSSSETEFYLEVGNYSFTLTNGETITIKVPYGYTLTVIESDDNSGYTTTVAVDGGSATSGKTWSGSITADTSIVYTNSKEAIPDTGINLDSAPYIAMLIAVVLFGSVTMIYRRRRLL